MPPDSGHRKILIIKAKEDLEAAKYLCNREKFSEEIVLFHCQQAVEKALKAYLDFKGVRYPKSHDIEALLSLCQDKDISFKQINYVVTLTPFAIEIRYDEFIDIPISEIKKMVDSTQDSLDFILGKLQLD